MIRSPLLIGAAMGVAVATSLGLSARAQPAPAGRASAYLVQGFRSARFGMDVEAVRAAAARDFNIEPAGMSLQAQPREQTTSLQAGVMRLNPGPGPAVVTYVFDHGGRLIRVNVSWISASNPNDLQRQAMMNAGLRLQRYFHELPSPPAQANDGGVMDANTLALYRARDARGAEVAVTVSGVRFERIKDGAASSPSSPTGAAILSVIYVESPQRGP
jgi:hypothetical protein